MEISVNDKETGVLGSNLPENTTLTANKLMSNNSFGVENSRDNPPRGREDPQIDVTECTKFIDDHLPAETICLDEPETSSSFDGSISDHETGVGFGDQEIDSTSCEDYPLSSEFDPPGGLLLMRKQKLSYEWRKFNRSIVWRCKWLELKVKELQFQAQKYDKQLDEYYTRKQSELEKQKSEGIDTKSLSLSCLTERKKVMKRKMRKRVEEETDIGLYMSQHDIFSYRENRKPASLDANYCNLADYSTDPKTKDNVDEIFFEGECSYPEFTHHDKIMSELILKIAKIQSRAREMKRRIEKVVSENSEKLCAEPNLASPEMNIGGISDSAHALSKHTEDLLTSENAGSSQGEAIRTAMEDVKDETEMNEEEDLNYFEKVINKVTCKPDSSLDSPTVNSPVVNSPVTNSRVSARKRKRQVSWISSSSSARRRSAATRRWRT